MLSDPAILERTILPERGDLSPEVARFLLDVSFSERDRQRYAELSEKAQAGLLTESEERELDDYLSLNDFLAILKAKAAASLGPRPSAA